MKRKTTIVILIGAVTLLLCSSIIVVYAISSSSTPYTVIEDRSEILLNDKEENAEEQKFSFEEKRVSMLKESLLGIKGIQDCDISIYADDSEQTNDGISETKIDIVFKVDDDMVFTDLEEQVVFEQTVNDIVGIVTDVEFDNISITYCK